MAESGDIFQILFGRPSKDAPFSLLVDNPYRWQLQSDAKRDRKLSPVAGAAGAEVHGGRWKQEKRRGSDEEVQSSRKRKKESRGGEDAGEIGGAGETKRSKKRKRVEIEEYEAMRYGPPVVGKIEPLGSLAVGTKRKTLDDAADTMVVSEEAYEDESKLQRTVFAGNLPVKVKKKALLKEFRVYAGIESVRVRSVPIIDWCGRKYLGREQ